MAGGIGSRFWPMSTPERPKQFIDVLGCGRSLIQLTADRFKGVCLPQHTWVVTSKRFADLVHEQLPEIPKENILLEPCMRNTAPCIAYVSWKIKSRFPDANMVVSPADHVVMDVEGFRKVIGESLRFTKDRKVILTLGMKPTRPETGYGYIEAMEQQAEGSSEGDFLRVASFREKPQLDLAKEYVSRSNFYWNSGIFIWNVNTIEAAFRTYQPTLSAIFDELSPSFYTDEEQDTIDLHFPRCENISVDYAIMEKAKEIFVRPASFGWSDLGTWGSLYEKLPKDNTGNAVVGNHVKLVDSNNCIVHTPEEKRVVIHGLDGYIIAERDNTLLICKLSEEQRIKEFSQE